MDSYKIRVKKSVNKDLRKINKVQVQKIVEAIENLAIDPHPQSSKKLVGSNMTFRVRIGNYRIIYMVDNSIKEIEIQRIRHRKDVYK